MSGKITIENTAENVAVIDIEGIIGVAENQQFNETSYSIATYASFKDAIAKIKNDAKQEIIINIRSTGGNVNDALLIYDTLKELDMKITTKCFGYVASAATIIAQAASPGRREISANSLYLIHKAACSTEGNANTIAQTIEMLDKTDKRITAIYADRSGKRETIFEKLMAENNGNGRWLSPEEAIEYGLADKIIAATPINAASRNMVVDLGLPPIPKKRKNMIREISETWNRILKSAGIKQVDENSENIDIESKILDANLLENAAREVINARAQKEKLRLETEAARAAALPTSTKPKEDPEIQEINPSPNEYAYMADLQGFI